MKWIQGTIGLLVLAAVGCTTTGSLDRSTVPAVGSGSAVPARADIADVPVRGFPVRARTAAGSVSGELLAVDAAGIWVLGRDGIVPVSGDTIVDVRVRTRPGSVVSLIGWVAAGATTTLTHGLRLYYTAPVWVAIGLWQGNSTWRQSRATVDGNRIEMLAPFARYPAGPPPSLK